ncbi:hypothetical protein [Pseudoxanthomonas suwonensis]|jgi:hypothetical protein|nr:hypothetical protein [Pseudoxanthomonas suwonensis]
MLHVIRMIERRSGHRAHLVAPVLGLLSLLALATGLWLATH